MKTPLHSLLVLALSPVAFAQPQADSPATVAARERKDKLRSVAVTFSMKEVREKHTITPPVPLAETTTAGKVERLLPETQLVLTSEANHLVVAGKRVRYESDHPVLNVTTGRVAYQTNLGTIDGTNVRKLRTPAEGNADTNRIGIVADTSRAVVHKFDYLYPLLLTINGIDAAICDVPFSEYTATGTTLPIQGATCDGYVCDPGKGGTTELWVSPKDDYLPRRIRYLSQGRLTRQVNVTAIRKDADGHAYPSEWTLTQYSPVGTVTSSRVITIREFAANTGVSDDQFTITFPPGLEINDVVQQKYFLVREDGSWVEFTPGEKPDALREKMQVPWWQRYWWAIVSAAAGLILSVGVVRWVRRRRSNLSATNQTNQTPNT
jgi:hypothetical protein